MADKEFKLMVVLGDICYDLDSDNGNRYMEFLAMAQEFISKIPCVFIPGNHENYSEDDKILLNSTF
jgi:metallophosphoesterase superfamily enzyme